MFERQLYTITPLALGRRKVFLRAESISDAIRAFGDIVGLTTCLEGAVQDDGEGNLSQGFQIGTGSRFYAYATLSGETER